MNDIDLFGDGAAEAPKLTEMINISKYVVTLNGVQTNPGETGFATEANLRQFNRALIREVQSDVSETSLDE